RDPLLLQATYFDTDDLRLARAGASLRYRNHDGWTVTLPGVVVDGMLVRGEHRIDGRVGTPPDAAVDLLRGYVRTARLGAVARLRTRRDRIDLVDLDGKPQAEVVDDEVSVLDGRRVAARFRELEVEVIESAPPSVAAEVVERLREAGAGDPDPTPKIVRALGPRALAPPDIAPLVPATPGGPAAHVVRNTIAGSVRRLIAHDAGVRLGDDPEFVHQARVATRRLRSDLRTFRSLLDPEGVAALRVELRWVGAELGAVRDTEVLIELLRAKTLQLPEQDRAAADGLVARLVTTWENQRIELLGAMRSERYCQLLDRLVDAANGNIPFTDLADHTAGTVLPPLVDGPWKHLRSAVDALEPDPADEALHDIRIRAKRCRYAAEAVVSVAGRPARRFARRIAAIQEVLGDHHDAIVAETWLRDAAARATPSEAFAAGQLAGLERVDEAAARAAWPQAWAAARGKQLRRWW
ncbi:MAG: CYTH and CHAD domain-containing protein, partial [Acidimicrobiia bacterium]